MEAMARHRSHSVEFKRRVVQEFIAGETLHALAKGHDVSRTLIRVWVKKLEAGALDDDAEAADLLQTYEARIAALERLVGKQALEIEFLKGALRSTPRPRSAKRDYIRHHRPNGLSIAEGCRLMGLSRSTYYDAPAVQARRQPSLGATPRLGQLNDRKREHTCGSTALHESLSQLHVMTGAIAA
jgi:transposase-like protein